MNKKNENTEQQMKAVVSLHRVNCVFLNMKKKTDYSSLFICHFFLLNCLDEYL